MIEQKASLPVRGAWIEILYVKCSRRTMFGRSPCGERGLKFVEFEAPDAMLPVAPRAGSVD